MSAHLSEGQLRQQIRIQRHIVLRLAHLTRWEIERRGSAETTPQAVLAPDFDIIRHFLRWTTDARKDRHVTSRRAIEALIETSDFRFTLLPGSVYQLLRFCSQLAKDLPPVQHADDLLSLLRRSLTELDLTELDFDHACRKKLLALLRRLHVNEALATQLRLFLSAPNITGLMESGIPMDSLQPDARLEAQVCRALAAVRPDAGIRNAVDSLNLSLVLTTMDSGSHVTLVTDTTVLQRYYRLLEHRTQPKMGRFWPVLSPEDLLSFIPLTSVDRPALVEYLVMLEMAEMRLRHADSSMHQYRTAEPLSRSRDATDLALPILEILEDTQRTVRHFSDVRPATPQAGHLPELELPEILDPPDLAARGLAIAERAEEAIRTSALHLAENLDRWGGHSRASPSRNALVAGSAARTQAFGGA
jgi:hypothetical protein